ncbi:hypothetical protein HWV62_441 [Athelia sp. TMB]|nr:hypothetical protein HWV62_441 [Athelia sp. TMB]
MTLCTSGLCKSPPLQDKDKQIIERKGSSPQRGEVFTVCAALKDPFIDQMYNAGVTIRSYRPTVMTGALSTKSMWRNGIKPCIIRRPAADEKPEQIYLIQFLLTDKLSTVPAIVRHYLIPIHTLDAPCSSSRDSTFREHLHTSPSWAEGSNHPTTDLPQGSHYHIDRKTLRKLNSLCAAKSEAWAKQTPEERAVGMQELGTWQTQPKKREKKKFIQRCEPTSDQEMKGVAGPGLSVTQLKSYDESTSNRGSTDTTIDMKLSENGPGLIKISLQKLSIDESIGAISSDVMVLSGPSDLLHSGQEAVNVAAGALAVLSPLASIISKLEILAPLAEAIAPIHPIIEVAYNLSSSLYKAVKAIIELHSAVIALVHVMSETYSFVDVLQSRHDQLKVLQINISKILVHSVHSINFIRMYLARSQGGRVKKFARSLLSDDEVATVKELADTFEKLKKDFMECVTMQTALLAARNHDTMASLDHDHKLQKLTQTEMTTANRDRCLPDTRLDVILHVAEWAANPKRKDVLWISGVVGSGKSTVTTSLHDLFWDMSYLGAFLYFDSKSKYDSATFVSILALQLSEFDPRLQEAIVSAVKSSERTRRAKLRVQFDTFILEPLQTVDITLHHPILIIIDGLDQCGDADTRRQLLEALVNMAENLRGLLRIIITSQPDPEVAELLQKCDTLELDTTSEANHSDIKLYFKFAFDQLRKQKRKLDQNWPSPDQLLSLVTKAGGLFLWSVVVARNIAQAPNPVSRLDTLLKGALGKSKLDDIYSESLLSIEGREDEEFPREFKAVVGMIIVATEPLSSATIDAFRGKDAPPAEYMITRLGSILTLPSSIDLDPHLPIRTLHSSFDDYLSDIRRCGEEWHIDIQLQHRELADNCISYLASYFENAAPVDISIPFSQEYFIQEAGERGISIQALAYASTSWPYHVCAMDASESPIVESLEYFFQRNLLHWLELLSIFHRSREASRGLEKLSKRFANPPFESSDHLRKLAVDAQRFSQTFSECIERHPGAVYFSALPFTPVNSDIDRLYNNDQKYQYPWVVGGFQNQWQPVFNIIMAHDKPVTAVAFSPDDLQIASCSDSQKYAICLWDVDTGGKAIPDLRGHQKEVQVVAFAHFESRMHVISASLDNTVRTWDVRAGKETKMRKCQSPITTMVCSADGSLIVCGSKEDGSIIIWTSMVADDAPEVRKGHNDIILGLALSKNNKYLVSCSADQTVRLWDLTTNTSDFLSIESDDEEPPDAFCVAISSTGERVAAGLADGDIAIWDGRTREFFGPLEGHEAYVGVAALDFSPDDKILVSGADDCTVRLWDLATGAQIWKRPRRHDKMVKSVAFSHDGSRIAAGSDDGCVRIWDASPQQKTWKRDPVPDMETLGWAMAMSSDGKRIASGVTTDHTIIVWNPAGDPAEQLVLTGHKGAIETVGFSLDGLTLASGSQDSDILIWDVESGDLREKLSGHQGYVLALCYSPGDSSRIVSGSNDKTVRVWTIGGKDGAASQNMFRHRSDVWTVAFSNDGNRVASGCSDGDILLWSIGDGVVLKTFTSTMDPHKGVMSIVFGHAGDRLFSSDRDGHLHSWDLCTNPELAHTEDRNFLSRATQDLSNPLVIRGDGTIQDFASKKVVSYLPPVLSVNSVVAASSCKTAIALGASTGDLYILCFPS